MKTTSLRPAAPLAAVLALAATLGAAPVRTESGLVSGVAAAGVVSWKGIPFAAPPVGDLRWREPRPAAPWKGVRAADAYAHDCMQEPFPSDAAPLGTPPAEDCLYLNVWAPEKPAAPKLPVMVWIHGGGFVNGGSSPAVYDGSRFAKRGVVFVSFNHRLGRFGFFAHPALSKESPKGPLGNYGYLDQIAALKWVQRERRRLRRRPRQRDCLRRIGRGWLRQHPDGVVARARALPQGDRGVRRRPRRRDHDPAHAARGRGGRRRVREKRRRHRGRRGSPRRAPQAPGSRARPRPEPHEHGPAARHVCRADDRRGGRHGRAGDGLPGRAPGPRPVPHRGQQPRVRLHAAAPRRGRRDARPLREGQGPRPRRVRPAADGQQGRGRDRHRERPGDGGTGAPPRASFVRGGTADLRLPLLLRRVLDTASRRRARSTRPRSLSCSRPCGRSTARRRRPRTKRSPPR